MEAATQRQSNGFTTDKSAAAPPLHTVQLMRRTHFCRIYILIYTFAISTLFYLHSQTLLIHHSTNSPLSSSIITTILLISDLCLAFQWSLSAVLRFGRIRRKQFPENLPNFIKRNDYPGIDVFICTADPYKEPPVDVVNTALSVMAYDYPPEKLSVYVSDDGGSSLTLFAFFEAAKFAAHWLPFCTNFNVKRRNPKAFFQSNYASSAQIENLKVMYERMKGRIESVVEKGRVGDEYITNDKERQVFTKWTNKFTRQNHPSVIQVLLDNKEDKDIMGHNLPNLVYVSREKSNTSHHHHKAGALNSLDINLEKIQAAVGKEIGFLEDRWKDKTQEDRAAEILNVLQQKKFLLLLDDIWEKVDLTKIGVPLPDRENNSNVVFTTRSETVCNEMGAEEKIEVLGLTKKKALQLFQEKVGQQILDIHPDIPQLAETVARMCNGLPLALITVGRAMASKKTPQAWRVAVDVLTKSVSDVSGTKDPVYALLKFSYESLPSEKVKCCFLYSSLFPEDFGINKFNLIDYWVGEGFLGERDGARNDGYNIISILIDACLLEDEGKDVKMHDLIREVALWIALECGKFKDKYLVEAGAQLSEAPEIGRWETVRRISLMANHIQNLTRAPRCNDLLTLFLGNNHLKTIANSFFQFMPSLKVVDLSENRQLTEFPSGISQIDSLQYLNLSKTGIRQLPIELKKLVRLKCLNLEYTYELQTIPLQLISCFSNLKVLRMVHCASSDRVIGDGIRIGGHESLVRDLQLLEHLNVLTITIRHPNMLEILASLDMFQVCTQALSLHHFKHSRLLNISFLEDMRCLAELEVVDCLNLTELCVEESLLTRKGCFNSLHKVSIVNCSKLVDLTWLTLAPNLEFLIVSRCSSIEQMICQGKLGETNVNAFGKLETLQLVSLPKLKSIYPNTLPFRYLKEIIVDECPKLRKLPLNSNSARGNRIVIQGWEDWWKNLEWEDEATRSIFIHSFKGCMY